MRQAIENSLNDTQDSGTATRKTAERHKVGVVRISIGKKVFSHDCKLAFQSGTQNPYIRISYRNDSPDKSKRDKNDEVTHTIFHDSITEMHYYLEDKNEDGSELEDELLNSRSGSDATSFLAMRVHPSEKNGLSTFSRAYLQDSSHDTPQKDLIKKYVVVEVRNDDEFERKILDKLREHRHFGIFLEYGGLSRKQARNFTFALREDDKKDQRNRTASPKKRVTRSSTRSARLKSDREENKTILVYPFDAEEDVFDNACKDLTEIGGKIITGRDAVGKNIWSDALSDMDSIPSSKASSSDEDGATSTAATSTVSSGRTHYLTIRNDDMDRLEDGEFLNDTLIDFFMRW